MRLYFGLTLAILFTGSVYANIEDDTSNEQTQLPNDQDAESSIIKIEHASVTRLNEISHRVRTSRFIDITLTRESFEEECYVHTPDGNVTKADIFIMEGVKVQKKSNFVSCRVTIGPMAQNLVGNWELCGKSATTEKMRCQPIIITLVTATFSPITRTRETHQVHIGDDENTDVTGNAEISTCHLITPDGEDLVITPDVKYPHIEKISTTNPNSCGVVIKDITRDMLGDWLIYVTFNQPIFGLNEAFQPFTLQLYTFDEEDTNMLNQINHNIRQHGSIDISLNKESFEEECYVRPPNGDLTRANIITMAGVKTQTQSDFVSCRVTITPITVDMLGVWTLCGKSVVSGEIRCQPASIAWMTATFSPITRTRETHQVYIGDDVNTSVTGNAEVSTCHVVTPDGEDLVITPEVQYPHIEKISATNPNSCSVVIKDITRDMLGDWLIYVTFNQPIFGLNEAIQPFTLQLYNEVDADVIYNITTLNNQEHRVKVGSNLSVKVSHATGRVENCIYTTPSGQTFDINSDTSAAPKGVLFRNNEAFCNIYFTPITEDMFGKWQIIGKFKNGVLFDEKRLTFKVIEEASDEEDINMLNEINHHIRQDASIDISLNKESFEEECYVRPPNGDLTRANIITMAGVKTQTQSDFVSCRVTITPITVDMLGVWTLCGKSVVSGEIRCQPASIAWRSNNWSIITRTQFTHPVHFGGSVNSGVSTFGTLETCHVVTPSGEDLVITTDVEYPHIKRSTVNNPSLCSVVIENITQDMLGAWLIYGTFRSLIEQTEVRLPLVFQLYDENNPFGQAYNVTELQNQNHLVHVGTNLTLEVSQRTGIRQDCIYTAPSGETFSINNDNSRVPKGVYFSSSETGVVCQIALNPITEEAVGEWQISLKLMNGVLFEERRQTFRIIVEDPENPLKEDIVRDIQFLMEQNIITNMNSIYRIAINRISLIENESCHLIAPDGRQYAFIDGFNVPNVEIIHEDFVECGVILHVVEENMIGTWTILARARGFSGSIERRLPATIRVEENFVLQNDIDIREGADLYLHLNDAISVPETCTLFGPDGNEFTEVEFDPIHASACGYIVRDVNQTHNGTWVIEYGPKIKRRGSVNVEVIGSQKLSLYNLRWTIGDSVDISVGPENAVYCVIQDSYGHNVFDDFGQCKIVLERVSVDHRGMWTMHIGKPGTVRLQRYDFYVEVHSVDGLPIVNTNVERNLPSVMLTCSVPAQHEVHACKFRDPQDNILVAAHGVGQDNYTFNGAIVNYESDAHSHDCTLRLINPSVADMGIWRCGLDTSTGTHYGFLTVLCPHLMQNPEVAASVVTEPMLQSTNVSYLEGEPVTLSCSISSALRYCYFRARNGTTYNVFPRMSPQENFEYVGAGLDAGECGIRFNRFAASESGQWSCHVGLLDTTTPELRAEIEANVTAKMSVRHYWFTTQAAVVEARIYNGQAIEYCRFVRMNGEGFTSDNVPDRYELEPMLHAGSCILLIRNPDIIDLHPWTIAAKLVMGSGEISMTTTENLLVMRTIRNPFSDVLFWVIIMFLVLIILGATGVFVPKKNRDWTYKRASGLSRSFRSSFNKSFLKKPPVTETKA